jgi:hypothetical protein
MSLEKYYEADVPKPIDKTINVRNIDSVIAINKAMSRSENMNNTDYCICLVFSCNAEKEQFVKKAGLENEYLQDGNLFASKFGIQLDKGELKELYLTRRLKEANKHGKTTRKSKLPNS